MRHNRIVIHLMFIALGLLILEGCVRLSAGAGYWKETDEGTQSTVREVVLDTEEIAKKVV